MSTDTGLAECDVHVIDRTQGYGVEATRRRHGFDAGRPDLGGEVQCANGLAEKRGLFALGFGEGDGDLGAEKLDRDAGEASAGAEVW